jgi:hypothetical protein
VHVQMHEARFVRCGHVSSAALGTSLGDSRGGEDGGSRALLSMSADMGFHATHRKSCD